MSALYRKMVDLKRPLDWGVGCCVFLGLLFSGLLHAEPQQAEKPSKALTSSAPLVWVVNSIEASDIVALRYQPLVNYLSKAIHKEIVFRVPRNYEHGNEMLLEGSADIAILGPAPFLKLRALDEQAVEVLVSKENNNTPNFYGAIVTRKNSNLKTVADCLQKTFAFGSQDSTLAFYMPANQLLDAGIKPNDLKSYVHLQSHDAVAEYVIMGRADAGGVKQSVAKKYSQYLNVIDVSPPIRDHAFVARSSLPAELKQQIKQALLSLKDKSILQSVKPSLTGFIPADNQAYDSFKSIMHRVDQAYQVENQLK